MVFLFECMGKVTAEMEYDAMVQAIKEAIANQTNQAVVRYKRFTGMAQGDQPFSCWWSKVKEQADKCTFAGYNLEIAARDAIQYQTNNTKLRKRMLAEDLDLVEVIKLGLAYKQSESKSNSTEKKDTREKMVKKLDSEEVVRLQIKPD